MPHANPYIVDADWLEARLDMPALVILDASWYLPATRRNPKQEYAAAHIPGALFWDHELIVDPASTLPHTLPSPSDFAQHAGRMGISHESMIVVYDGMGYFSAPRAWWMLRVMGASQVYVLDGGFKGWQDAGRPITDAPTPTPMPTVFIPDFDAHHVVDCDEMRILVTQKTAQIVDARGEKRFYGLEKEMRAGVRSGHMSGAKNVPYSSLAQDGYLKSNDDIRAIFAAAGISLEQEVVTSCGSGITAALLVLALVGLGHRHVRLYDGSWAQWGALPDTPIEQAQ